MSKPSGGLTWRKIKPGAIVTDPGSSMQTLTGDWRSQRPVFTQEHCIRCGLCYIYCPDIAIRMNEYGYPEFDLDYCKGCGICARECFTVLVDKGCITMVDEEEFE